MAEGDSDLANQVSVETQELAWQQEQLADAIAEQASAAADLETQQSAIQAELERFASQVGELEDRLAEEEAAAAAAADAGGSGGGSTDGGRRRWIPSAGHRHRLDPDVPRERSELVRRLVRRPEARGVARTPAST